MRFLFFGAGAIGTYIGGSLARAGHDVSYLEQPEMIDSLRRDGLRLAIGRQTDHIPVLQAYTSAAEALEDHPPDVMVFALKSYDTAAAIEELKSIKDPLPSVLCLQNGVENETALEMVFGPRKVIAGTVTSAVGRSGVGSILLERKRGIGIAADHPLSASIADSLNQAGLNALLFPSAPSMKWSKMLTNLIANASAAILGIPPRAVYADPRLFLLEREMLRECLRVMRTSGISVSDLPGTPVRALAFAVERLPASLSRPILTRSIGSGRGGKMPSFYLDLQSGRGKTEVQWLNGAVDRVGVSLGVPAPINRMLTDLLTGLAEGREKSEKYTGNPDNLIACLPRDLRSRIGLK